MKFELLGKEGAPSLMLIPGLGVSYEIFLPLVELLKDKFRITAVQVDGFTLGEQTRFTSVDDQAAQTIAFIRDRFDGHLDGAYGLSLGGKILSRILERDEVTIDHAILDAAPLLPLPKWLVGPLRYYQSYNVWTCYHWTGFWRRVFHSHYFDLLQAESSRFQDGAGVAQALAGLLLDPPCGEGTRRRVDRKLFGHEDEPRTAVYRLAVGADGRRRFSV